MWAFLQDREMGKGKRNQYWQQHEQAVEKMEKAKAKPLKNDREKVWQRASTDYLIANHFCQDCQKRGYTSPAEFVAHIQPPGESQLKFWNIDNWQALCEPCFQRIVGAAIPKVLEPIPRDAKLYTVK